MRHTDLDLSLDSCSWKILNKIRLNLQAATAKLHSQLRSSSNQSINNDVFCIYLSLKSLRVTMSIPSKTLIASSLIPVKWDKKIIDSLLLCRKISNSLWLPGIIKPIQCE